jgi:dephospho-CoA kinase
MLKIGLTGNVGAGKTRVARIWNEDRGALTVDADYLGKAAVRPGGEALPRLVERFGSEILNPDGTLNRRRMGRTGFSSPESLAALNAIVHPVILRLIDEEIETACGSGAPAVVVDAALIYEFGLDRRMDCVVVVDAPLEVRRARVLAKDKMDAETLEWVIRSQLAPEELRRRADYVIENDSDLRALKKRAVGLFDEIIEKYKGRCKK